MLIVRELIIFIRTLIPPGNVILGYHPNQCLTLKTELKDYENKKTLIVLTDFETLIEQ